MVVCVKCGGLKIIHHICVRALFLSYKSAKLLSSSIVMYVCVKPR